MAASTRIGCWRADLALIRLKFNLNRETKIVVKASVIVAMVAVVVIVASLTACTSTNRDPLIFAAASLVDVMEEVVAAYEDETGRKVRFNFAGSNLIANQIIAGAPWRSHSPTTNEHSTTSRS